MKVMRYIKGLVLVASAVVGVTVTSCEDEPDKYEIADGLPTLRYVRMTDPAVSDSLITGANLSSTVCLVGDNLRSIYELYFNDQKAVLNTSVMTDNTVIVDIPSVIPSVVTNKIYMVTKGKDTVDFDFNVIVPAPQVTSMSCEYAAPGSVVTVAGNYFIDDPNVPLNIQIGDVPVTEITSVSQNSVSFVIPQNVSDEPAYVNVTSIYGTGRSTFRYREDTGILFDFDDDGDDARQYGDGWQWGSALVGTFDDVTPLDKAYLRFKGKMGDSKWDDTNFAFQYWPVGDAASPDLNVLSPYLSEVKNAKDLDKLQLKFEVNVPEAWSAAAMQIALTPKGMFDGSNRHNGLFDSGAPADETQYPRALWRPWEGLANGYKTDGWVTVTIPLADFHYTSTGSSVSPLSDTDIAGLTIFVYGGGVSGTQIVSDEDTDVKCIPTICIDNIRIVPIN